VEYAIVWSSKWNRGVKVVDSPIAAESWIAELRDNGADAIRVMCDGLPIDTDDLPAQIKREIAARREC
jgi:hypothetical protein